MPHVTSNVGLWHPCVRNGPTSPSLKQSIFHCQSIGAAHEVSSSRIRRVGERRSTGSRTTHGQAAQLPGRTLCGDAVGGPLHGSVLDNRAEVSHQTTRQRERQMRSAAQLQCFASVHGVVQNLFRVRRHLLRSAHHRPAPRAGVRRKGCGDDGFDPRLRSLSSDCAESDSGPVAHRANMGSELCG